MRRCKNQISVRAASQTDLHSMENHRQEREQRDATRKAAWDSQARNEALNRQLNQAGAGGKKSTLADRSKYQFEADSDDDQMENEIEGNIGMFHQNLKNCD